MYDGMKNRAEVKSMPRNGTTLPSRRRDVNLGKSDPLSSSNQLHLLCPCCQRPVKLKRVNDQFQAKTIQDLEHVKEKQQRRQRAPHHSTSCRPEVPDREVTIPTAGNGYPRRRRALCLANKLVFLHLEE